MPLGPRRAKAGFVTVEILAVLAIVFLLAAISFAVFARVRERGRSTVCLSNQLQIALAILQYTQDSSGYFPPRATSDSPTGVGHGGDWKQLITPYLKNAALFSCPSSNLEDDDHDYAYNWLQLNEIRRSADRNPRYSQFVGKHESVQEDASTIVMTFDNATYYSGDESTARNGRVIETPCGKGLIGDLHSGGANVSFVDGHVKWQSEAEQAKFHCARFSAPR